MPVNGRYGGKALTGELRKLAGELHTTDSQGNEITKEQALADLIWKQALGWEEVTRDDSGSLTKKVHPPVAWAQQFLWERMEGKAPVAVAENEGGMKASQKVRELSKQRVNALASAVAIGKPPSYKRNAT